MTLFAIELLVRLAVFGGVFAFAAHRHEKIEIKPKFAVPLVALVFAVFNTGLYWLAKPILNLATFGSMWFLMPFVVNGLLLWGTDRVLRPLSIKGIFPMVWLAGLLTLAHGVMYVVFELIL